MPTYAYACSSCQHRFEVHQSFTDDALTDCPECSGTLRKVFNSVGVVFKGSGFYRTDSRGSADKGGSSASTPAAGGKKDTAAASGSSGSGSSGSGSSGSGSSGSGSSGSGSSSSGSSGAGSSSSSTPAA
ncbi:hypothetical protein NUM3379_08330 [Kineococcus sp. NUM-3379]